MQVLVTFVRVDRQGQWDKVAGIATEAATGGSNDTVAGLEPIELGCEHNLAVELEQKLRKGGKPFVATFKTRIRKFGPNTAVIATGIAEHHDGEFIITDQAVVLDGAPSAK